MNNRFINTLLATLVGLYAGAIIAQDYPTFYSDDPNYTTSSFSPEANFPSQPNPCASDDETCIDTYLGSYDAQLEGNMNAQRPPSPVYTWSEKECALNNVEKCDELEKEWQAWNTRAVSGSLDFVQGTEQSGLKCNEEAYVYDWWTLRHVYKCQDSQ